MRLLNVCVVCSVFSYFGFPSGNPLGIGLYQFREQEREENYQACHTISQVYSKLECLL